MMCCFTFSVTAMQAPCLMERTEHSRRFIPSLVQSRPRRYHPYGVLGQYMDGYPTYQEFGTFPTSKVFRLNTVIDTSIPPLPKGPFACPGMPIGSVGFRSVSGV